MRALIHLFDWLAWWSRRQGGFHCLQVQPNHSMAVVHMLETEEHLVDHFSGHYMVCGSFASMASSLFIDKYPEWLAQSCKPVQYKTASGCLWRTGPVIERGLSNLKCTVLRFGDSVRGQYHWSSPRFALEALVSIGTRHARCINHFTARKRSCCHLMDKKASTLRIPRDKASPFQLTNSFATK